MTDTFVEEALKVLDRYETRWARVIREAIKEAEARVAKLERAILDHQHFNLSFDKDLIPIREVQVNKAEAIAYLKSEAKKRGLSVQEFIDTDVRRVLEKAWEIQMRTGKPVSISQLHAELNGR